MLRQDKALKLIEIFITCDDFCKALTQWQIQQGTLPSIRQGELTDSEMLASTIFYHHSGAKCFHRAAGAVLLPGLGTSSTGQLFPPIDQL